MISLFLTIGSTDIAFQFWRTTIIVGTQPCAYPNGTATGTCRCEVENEDTLVTGVEGKIKEKMVSDIQYDFATDPETLLRLGALINLTYKNKGPNAGYL